MAEYDLIIKALADQYPEHFLTVVRGPGAEVEKIERLEKEAVATQRTSDILLQVTESGYEYVLLIEIQTRPDKNMPLSNFVAAAVVGLYSGVGIGVWPSSP